MDKPKNANRPIITLAVCALGLTALMMGFAVAKKTGLIDADLAKRGAAAMIGILFIVAGNFVPKLRLFQPDSDVPGASAVDRFAGWAFVLSGAAFVTVWTFAPIEKAMLGSPMIGLAVFMLVLARWLAWKGNRTHGLLPRFTPGRIALGLLLVSVMWTFAIFLADAIWGDSVAQWLAIGFTFMICAAAPFAVVALRLFSRP